ncbi:MAG: hypothetical protein IJ887_00295 [Prevotella sp.]|nr:hypothetical protein [Prevotella sp.]MBR3481002.1 hypothetical protein [Prevotella sp.]MBR6188399.1 hypothetical protein [Prevotella sp.]
MGEHSNDITQEMALLHTLSGADYARQVERIAMRNEFYPLKGEHDIFVCGGERDCDYNNLLNAARKAVEHGYTVFLLPNPSGTRSADIILKKKNIYRMCEDHYRKVFRRKQVSWVYRADKLRSSQCT